jgi:alkylation response protein AidB-like acyl-CoA dehydrogenase
MLVLDAHDPGVSVDYRRILTGGTLKTFALNDVRVPVEDVIGPEQGGWQVAQTLLDLERGGRGITLDQRAEIEEREREFWKRAP